VQVLFDALSFCESSYCLQTMLGFLGVCLFFTKLVQRDVCMHKSNLLIQDDEEVKKTIWIAKCNIHSVLPNMLLV